MLFGIDIESIVSDAFAGNLHPATLTREIPGAYDPVTDTWTDGQTLTFSSKGIVQSYSDEMLAAGLVSMNDRKVLLIAQPLNTTPKSGDKIEIEGQVFTVTGIPDRDPAGATWTIRGQL